MARIECVRLALRRPCPAGMVGPWPLCWRSRAGQCGRSGRRARWPRCWPRPRRPTGATPDPGNTLYLELAAGRVVIELAPRFAPRARREHPAPGAPGLLRRPRHHPLAGQLRRAVGRPGRQAPARRGAQRRCRRSSPCRWRRRCRSRGCRTADGYAPEVGFCGRLPGGARPRAGQAWLAHCYGMVGAGRDVDEPTAATAPSSTWSSAMRRASSTATSRWSAGWCRAWSCCRSCRAAPARWGSTRSRSSTCRSRACGWRPTCRSPSASRLEVMRTDTATFTALVESRRNRQRRLVQACRPGTSSSATCRCRCGAPEIRCGAAKSTACSDHCGLRSRRARGNLAAESAESSTRVETEGRPWIASG